ncbi:MAG TPA: NUDIX domain-containing protein [Candidatus Pacearchaeota archaeon]|nr:NUDIX domain-containing protein [Candidatus Pacearchaeota archaeon]
MLNKKESDSILALLGKIKNPENGLPQPIFDALAKLTPFVACEIVLASPEGILLTWRDDQWWKGWHFPGGLMRFREDFLDRIQKVAQQELGISIQKYDFLFLKNCNAADRAHVISLVFRCYAKSRPKKGRFFKKMPSDIIEGHKDIWKKAHKIIFKR